MWKPQTKKPRFSSQKLGCRPASASASFRGGPSRASVGAEYGIRRANLNAGSRDYLFQNGGAVLQYRTGEQTTFDLSGGLTYLVDRTFDVTRSGPYVKASLVHRAQRATVGGEYQRNYTPSFGVVSAQRSQELLGYVEMPFRQNRFYVQESAT